MKLRNNANESIIDILKHADMAMYKTKESGKNPIRFFDSSMERALAERIEMENDLRRALEEEEFYLVYQAKLDDKQKLMEFEALLKGPRKPRAQSKAMSRGNSLRWKHPVKGMFPQDKFIPVAEEDTIKYIAVNVNPDMTHEA